MFSVSDCNDKREPCGTLQRLNHVLEHSKEYRAHKSQGAYFFFEYWKNVLSGSEPFERR